MSHPADNHITSSNPYQWTGLVPAHNYNISNMFMIYQCHELYTQSFLSPQSELGSAVNYNISNLFIAHKSHHFPHKKLCAHKGFCVHKVNYDG